MPYKSLRRVFRMQGVWIFKLLNLGGYFLRRANELIHRTCSGRKALYLSSPNIFTTFYEKSLETQSKQKIILQSL